MLSSLFVRSSFALLFIVPFVAVHAADADLPPVSEFLIEQDYEIALARSAAPDRVSKDATVMVLGNDGYETVVEGTNSFVCIVMRSWGNPTHNHAYLYDPTLIVPECLDANAVRTILPVQLLRAELGAKQTPPAEIEAAVTEGFRSGRLQRTESVSFSYMLSAGMRFGTDNPGPAHIMIYLPDNYQNDTVGGFPYSERFIIVEGGRDEPFIAANIYLLDKAIEPDSD